MASRYSVIQYVPNPIADERINIGVLAFDDQTVRAHFLQNWNRVKHFGNEDISFLRKFADRMEECALRGLLFPGDRLGDKPNHERLIKVAKGWINSIQFTQPCGSLMDVDSLLEDAISTYLVEIIDSPKKLPLRDRQVASKIANTTVKNVLKGRGIQVQDYLKTSLEGKLESHNLDAVVANGKPYLAVHALSFEVQPPKNVLSDLTWAIVDVKDYYDLPFGVLILPPKIDSNELMNAHKNAAEKYKDLGANVLTENELKAWASKTLSQDDFGVSAHYQLSIENGEI
jgi:Protein of unknown function (DUF3037)